LIIIPVIDLLRGQAVHAIGGRRSAYRPLDSPLCRRGEVLPLVRRLHEDLACALIYVADLDAIRADGPQFDLVARITDDFPDLALWLDGGFRDATALDAVRQFARVRPVIGSETWRAAGALPDVGAVLSIDSDAAGVRDPSGIAGDPRRHPPDLILMDLTRVGGAQGPDLGLLRQWRASTPAARLYLAGGVRGRADLDAAAAAGAAGVLLASALHRGALGQADLAAFT
jgi:phosphoribosylformimino-5-aminoimidazole carboxamide ribotide isomerase